MEQKITGFHQDDELHWVAELQCGHFQHVRHQPPWTNRVWVITKQGRLDKIGFTLRCKKCLEGAPKDKAE